jgi:NitT/TauT family transport system substrate-binding protein
LPIAVVALLLAVLAFSVRQTEPGPQPVSKLDLRVGAFDGDVGALHWIAQDKGFFDKAGLNVVLTGFATGKQAVDALRDGLVDVATASEFVVATRGFDERDLRILSTVSQYWNKALIARRDRGVGRAADLAGKRVGVTVTSTAEHTLKVFLATNGIADADVTLVNLLPGKLVEAIADGQVDAAITWQPHADKIAHALGGNGVTLLERGTEAFLLALTRQDLLASKSPAFERMLAALADAAAWVRDNPAEAKEYLGQRFKLAPDVVEAVWGRTTFSVRLPQEMVEAMDSEARWFAQGRQPADPPNVMDFVHAQLLQAVDAKAVTVVGD